MSAPSLPRRAAARQPLSGGAVRRWRILVLVAAVLPVLTLSQVSCSGPYIQTTGVDFDPAKVSGFEASTTTREEVRAALGDPQETRITNDGLEIWVYRYEILERMDDGMLSGAGFNALLREKRLEVIFVEDKLRHTTFIEAKSPIERQPPRR